MEENDVSFLFDLHILVYQYAKLFVSFIKSHLCFSKKFFTSFAPFSIGMPIELFPSVLCKLYSLNHNNIYSLSLLYAAIWSPVQCFPFLFDLCLYINAYFKFCRFVYSDIFLYPHYSITIIERCTKIWHIPQFFQHILYIVDTEIYAICYLYGCMTYISKYFCINTVVLVLLKYTNS